MAVREFSCPKTKTDVREFLGLTGYYRKFIPDFSSIAASSSDLTRKFAPDISEWSHACEKAFSDLKRVLCDQPVLTAPRYDCPFALQTHASLHGIGAVLTQADASGKEHPITYYSRKLLARAVSYSATEQEGLAVVEACKFPALPSWSSLYCGNRQ